MPITQKQAIADGNDAINAIKAVRALPSLAAGPTLDAYDAACLATTKLAGALLPVSNPPTNPVPAAKPGPTNTGPRIAVTPWTGSNTFTSAQTIIGKSFAGQVNVTVPAGSTVTFIDCVFDPQGASYCIANWGAGYAIAQYCEFKNAQAAAMFNNQWTAQFCEVHSMQNDCFKLANNCTVQSCWGHDYGITPLSHSDFAQLVNGVNCKIIGNTIDGNKSGGHWTNSGVFANGSYSQVVGLEITGNWFEGGYNYDIYLQGNQTGSVVQDNIFEGTTQYGVLSNPVKCERPATWSNNKTGTGLVIALPAQQAA